MLAFSDPEVIRIVRREFVAVAANGIRLYTQQDAEGDLFRAIVSAVQQPYALDPSRQGIYITTPSGKVLAHIRNISGRMNVPETLRQASAEYASLPVADRARKRVGAVERDPAEAIHPPAGGMVLRTYTRRLQRTGERISASAVSYFRHDMVFSQEPQYDHVWVTRQELLGMLPTPLRPGVSRQVPESLALQICRDNLADTTWKGSDEWAPGEIGPHALTAKVKAVEAGVAIIAVHGTASFFRNGRQRVDAVLEGELRWSVKRQVAERFDMVALEKRLERGDRGQPLVSYFGVAFELADGSDPGDVIPPHERDWWFRDKTGVGLR
ncbi:MAG: hypothetical protein EB084_13400 [Proteobacteria bacterium]|nr:hypothetical protein [Pseudomonadota bacterium]